MVLIIRDGTVYIAESKADFVPTATEGDFTNYADNLHIVRNENNPGYLMLCNMMARLVDVLRYEDVFPARLTPKTLSLDTFPRIVSLLDRYGLMGEDRDNIDVIFARKDKCYRVNFDGCIDEVEEFLALCSDDHSAIGSYLKNKDMPIYELIRRIHIDQERLTGNVQFPIVVVNTKNAETKIIYREGEI